MMLEDLAKLAPLGTVVIASGALIVATWSLLAQKGVARRRAAIDFFLKAEMDDKLLAAYEDYKKGLAELRSSTDLGAFCDSEHYRCVRNYLNLFELLAVGIENSTFDERICYVYWKGFVLDTMTDTARLIDHLREKHKAGFYYRGFRRLHFRWMNNRELTYRWQTGSLLPKGPIPISPTP